MVGQVSTHSRPKAAGLRDRGLTRHRQRFQHTAARRRLEIIEIKIRIGAGFNTQPPEGGWLRRDWRIIRLGSFNTQPPEGGWLHAFKYPLLLLGFNTQPPEGGWN